MDGGCHVRIGLPRACGWALGAMGFSASVFGHCSVGPVCLSEACVCMRACMCVFVNLILSHLF